MNNNNKYNNRNLLLAIIVIFLGVIVIAGSFAYYTWTSGNVKKNILFNTSKALSEYIVYDEGESKFVGDFKIGNSYSDGIHTTISINKTSEAENVDLFATIYLKVNSIGESITNSMAVKWVLVDGDETSTNVISSGNFYGVEANEQFALKNFIPVTTTLKKYTVWIWLDQSENIPSSITGETLDTLVYTQVDQIQVMEKEIFEITKINANYQFINATVINNKNQIVKYNVTKTNTTPSVFNDVGDEYVYCNASGDACNLENYIVNDGTGTYYVWFKDSSENVISKEVNVSNIDATGPVCTFDMFNPSSIKGNETSQINLTCVDEIGIKNSNIDISDISVSNNSLLEVNSVIKSAVNNGYKYTIEVKALSLTDNGEVTLTLPANIIQNKANLGNTISTSGNISVLNTISISFNANGGSGGQSASVEATFGSSMPEISTTMPTKAGYTFMGWYDNADYTKGTQYYTASGTSARNFDKTTPMTLYAGWIDDNAPVFSSVTVSNTYDIKNYVKFTAIDEGAGIVGYNITTSTTAPTTWIPVVNGVEDATETKYAYDASWARVFHHNAHYGTVLYSDSTEAKSSNTVDKYSVLGNLENYRNTDGKFEFLLEYPGVSGYNRWIQTDNPATVTVANGTGDETVAGYSAVNVSWTGYYWGGLALSTSSATFIDGGIGHSSWYFAIGSYSAYKGGIPGPNSSMVSHVNLWTRIDDKPAITTNTLTRTIGDISSNGTYYIWAKDSLGNVSYESINISKVDTTAPSLSISSQSETSVKLNYSDNVGVTKYYFGTSNPANTNVTWTSITSSTSGSLTETISSTGTYYFAVQDAAGNRNIIEEAVLDFANQSKLITWSSSSQTLSITGASNGSGNYTYSEVSEKNASGTSTSYFTISGTTITAAAKTAPGVYSYTVKATDSSSGLAKTAVITITVNNVDDFTVSASLSGTTLTCSVSGTYSPVSNYNFTKCTSSGCDSYTSGTSTSMSFSLATTGTNKPYYCKAKLKHTNGEVSPEKSSSAVYLKFSLTSSSILCSASSNNTAYPLVYTGSCSISSGQVSFKTSGSKTLYVNTSGIYADIFAVGGGGGGASSHSGSCAAGSGGGGGKTSMTAAYLLTGSSYTITVGAGGSGGTSGGAGSAGGTSKFGSVISAAGGGGAEAPTSSISGAAGSGGSGGGRGGRNANGYAAGGVGGSYGANGSSNGTDAGGSGQGTTTCAFHKGTTSSCTSGYSAFGGGGGGGVGYNKTFGSAPGTGGAGGGGAGGYKLNVSPYNYVAATAGTANTGGGGGGGGTFISSNVCGAKAGGAGGSGIVMMMATDATLPFSYTGNYETVKNTGSVWEVKLLSNGTFKVKSNTSVDIFCVGGGGGGSSSPAMAVGGAGGGGGYTKTVSGTTLTAGTGYSVTIGAGGAGGKANLSNSTASAGSSGAASKFASLLTANGGSGGVLPTDVGADGGAGGSGGGAGGRNWSSLNNGGAGGSYGNNGSSNASSTAAGGTGQGTTTCAFGKGTTSSCNSGYKVYAAGGGGGAGYQTANYGAGGTGGGGLGGYVNSSFQYVAATSGTINTGSGGGGGGDWLKNGGDGGSGICIVRTHSTS